VIANTGVGDVDELLTTHGVGILISEFNEASYGRALAQLDVLLANETIRARCRATAHKEFNLETVGSVRYRRLYERLFRDRAAVRAASAPI